MIRPLHSETDILRSILRMSLFKMILTVVVWASAVLTAFATPVSNLGQSLATNGSVYCGTLDEPTIFTCKLTKRAAKM